MSDSLQVMFPDVHITVGGHDITLKPFTLKQLQEAITLLGKLKGYAGIIQSGSELDVGIIGDVIKEGGDDLWVLVARCVIFPDEWESEYIVNGKQRKEARQAAALEIVENLRADDGIELVMAFMKLNGSFFIQRVVPLITVKLESLKADGKTQ